MAALEATLSTALSWLDTQPSAMCDLLGRLVEASSHTPDRDGVSHAGDLLKTAVPLPCETIDGGPFAPHLVFSHNRRPGDPGVVLVGHHDTVFSREVFSGWKTSGDFGFGPGCFDMKGGLVVIAFALQALERANLLQHISLTFVSVSDEEVGSPSSAEHLRAVSLGADAALVFEAGRPGDTIITQRKGTGTVIANAMGRAAHAGNARADGASAILTMARFIVAAEALNAPSEGVSVNVGVVHGGTSKNTIADSCRAEIDLRFITPSHRDALRNSLDETARTVALANTTLTLTHGPSRPPLERTKANAALAVDYGRCQRSAGLGDGENPLVGGGSDAATTASVGVASIDGLGPRGAGFHTRDERVELSSLAPKSKALVRYLASRLSL